MRAGKVNGLGKPQTTNDKNIALDVIVSTSGRCSPDLIRTIGEDLILKSQANLKFCHFKAPIVSQGSVGYNNTATISIRVHRYTYE